MIAGGGNPAFLPCFLKVCADKNSHTPQRNEHVLAHRVEEKISSKKIVRLQQTRKMTQWNKSRKAISINP